MNTAISFLIVLGLLIFVHEFGHFILAKLFGVQVDKFSLGFGPKILGRRVGETEYLISAFPLGGYVKMLGEDPTDDIPGEDQERSFARKPILARFIIVAGGPVFNLIFAILVYFLIFAFVGRPYVGTRIGDIQEDSPAAAAGLLKDDVILQLNGVAMAHWEDVSQRIREGGGQPLRLLVQRGDQQVEIFGQPTLKKVKNMFGEEIDIPVLGITASTDVTIEKLGVGTALFTSFSHTWEIISLTLLSIVKIIQRVVPASTLGGPILIAQMAGQQLEAGWVNLFYFIGLLSVNLGILNLLPIPVLDGGHLVFFSVEAIRRRPLSVRTREILQQIGLVLLASLMFFVFYNDLARLLFKG